MLRSNRRLFLKQLSLSAGAFALGGRLAPAWAQPAAAAGPGAAVLRALDLRTDTRVNPLGLEPHHLRFFWRLQNAGLQDGWQVQVASTEEALSAGRADLWDSGRRDGSETTHVAYEGKPLASSQPAWWRARVWNRGGTASDWSDPARFEMGLLDATDWRDSAWIGCTRPMDEPELAPRDVMGPWIAAPEGAAAKTFAVTLDLPDQPVVSAMAYWGLSDSDKGTSAVVCIEGNHNPETVSKASRKDRGFVDLSFQLMPGQPNRLLFQIKSGKADVAACFGMRIVFADGHEQIVRSGPDWQAVPAKGDPLAVRVAGAYGEKPWGEAVAFSRRQLAPVWMRTAVPVEPGLSRARLYLSALGYGDATINGQAVGDAILSPAQTDYEDHALYDSHDVTALLEPGSNALAVLLDPGWYDEVGGFGSIFSYGRPGLKALLRLDYADGHSAFVTSGSGWQWKEGGLRAANTYLGERVDYRLDHEEWKKPNEGSNWQPVQTLEPLTPRLIPSDLPPMRRLRELKPARRWKVGEKTWLFDLGENITGWVRLAFDEPAGSTLRIRYTEMAENGKLWNTPESHWWCHGMAQNDEIISDGQPRVYESRFGFKGFRFFEIGGLSHEPAEGELVAFEIGNDAPWSASFESSDPLLNRLFANGRRSHYGNMLNSLTDCPHREKCLWGGDLHASWAFGFHALDSASFYRHQVRLGYTGPMAKGGVPGNVMVGKRLSTYGSSFNWSVSPLFLAWRLYQHDGDLETARMVYEPMRHFLDYFDRNAKEGIPHLTALADHAPPEGIKREPPNNQLISALNFFAAARRFEQLARALDKPEDADWARGIAAKAHTAVMRFYRPAEHTFGNGTHDSLALAFGVIDDPAEERNLAAALAGHYRKNGHQFDGGFMSYFIYPMLSRHGYGDDALKTMRNTQCVGPAWSIDRYDATSFWETFSPDPANQFERSLNHHAGSHPAAWLLTDLAGMRLDETIPGGRRLILAPAVPRAETLDWIKATMRTRHGLIESAWRRENGTVTWEFSVPPNCEARLDPPAQAKLAKRAGKQDRAVAIAAEMTVGPGRYRMNWPDGN